MCIRMPKNKYDPITEVKIKSNLIRTPQKINSITSQTVSKPVSEKKKKSNRSYKLIHFPAVWYARVGYSFVSNWQT